MNNKWIPLIPIVAFAIMVTFCKKEEDKKSNPCPTTSACGCSAKTKAECDAATDCCKWITGQGCDCK